MSASLVGSEMCIRDSLVGPRLRGDLRLRQRLRGRGGWRAEGRPDRPAQRRQQRSQWCHSVAASRREEPAP
eukprot:6443033-Alexandrium_andersonii.AAC.1